MTIIRILIATCLLLITGLVMPSSAEACSCVQPNVAFNTSIADQVFRGRVKKRKTFGTTRYFQFRIKRTYKGCYQAGDLVYLKSDTASTCFKNLDVGSRYLITGDDILTTAAGPVVKIGMCGYNVLFNSTTPAERAYLNSRYVDCPGTYQGCADGGPVYNCLVDPCGSIGSVGTGCTNGTCVANYCGGCNAEWYDINGEATCVSDWTITPP
jgi:hypothetical protein